MTELALLSALGSTNSPWIFEKGENRLEEELFPGLLKITLRKSDRALRAVVAEKAGLEPPDRPNRFVEHGGLRCGWLAPGEWLLSGPEGEVAALAASLGGALSGTAALITPLSHARSVLVLTGPQARQCLMTLTPLNLNPGSFKAGHCARSLLGEAGMYIEATGEPPVFRVIVDQSRAEYAWRLLRQALEVLPT